MAYRRTQQLPKKMPANIRKSTILVLILNFAFSPIAYGDFFNNTTLSTSGEFEEGATENTVSGFTTEGVIADSTAETAFADERSISIDYVGYISVPIIMIIGLFGNAMTILVVSRNEFRKMTLSLILLAVALSDTTVLVMFPINKTFFIDAIGFDIRALSLTGCKVFFWFWKTSKMTSSWFIVLISLERFVAVWFPFLYKSTKSKNRKKALFSILLVYLVIGGYNAVWDYQVDVIRKGLCMPNLATNGDAAMAKAFVTAGATLYSYAPCLIIVCLNTCTLVNMIHRRRIGHNCPASAQAGTSGKAVRLTAMLIGVSTAFVVLTVPIATLHAFSTYNAMDLLTSQLPSLISFREAAQVLEHLNYSINFYLYVICSSTFRSEFFAIFSRRKNAPVQ